MAELVFNDIFSVFGWKQCGPTNTNWPCVQAAHKKKTHPTDVAFYYEDPYEPVTVYINVDLKSYASGSISGAEIGAAIGSLIKAIECANVSQEFQERFEASTTTSRVDGMLFVYNHDGEFDKDFQRIMDQADESHFDMRQDHRVVVLSPEDVSYLATITTDIHVLRGKDKLPKSDDTIFFYPHTILRKSRNVYAKAASIETLTGPWQIIMNASDASLDERKVFIYYRESGKSAEEFLHLFGFLYRYQVLDGRTKVSIRMPFPHDDHLSFFEQAKERLRTDLNDKEEQKNLQKRLDLVTVEAISSIRREFSQVSIGWDRGDQA